METTTYTAETVATLIVAANTADSNLERAMEVAATALTSAAVATYNAITSGVKATAIAEHTLGANKDTIGRLAIVGQFLTLEGTVEPEGTSTAHFVRAMILKHIGAGVSIKVIRAAVTESTTQPQALQALANIGKPAKVVTPPAPELDAFQSALAQASALILSASNMLPLIASEDDSASVQSLTDAVALFANAFAARVAAPAVEVVAA